LVVVADGQALRIGERFLELGRQFILAHMVSLCLGWISD
jgi:hypothetical protein